MRWLKEDTGITVVIGPLASTTDATAYTSALAASDVRLKKNDAAWAAATNAPSHEENGYYEITLTSTETDTKGYLRLAVAKTGVLPYCDDFLIMLPNNYDSLVAGTEFLEVTSLKPDFSIASTTLTVKERDETTDQFTKTITTSASADPVTGLT